MSELGVLRLFYAAAAAQLPCPSTANTVGVLADQQTLCFLGHGSVKSVEDSTKCMQLSSQTKPGPSQLTVSNSHVLTSMPLKAWVIKTLDDGLHECPKSNSLGHCHLLSFSSKRIKVPSVTVM